MLLWRRIQHIMVLFEIVSVDRVNQKLVRAETLLQLTAKLEVAWLRKLHWAIEVHPCVHDPSGIVAIHQAQCLQEMLWKHAGLQSTHYAVRVKMIPRACRCEAHHWIVGHNVLQRQLSGGFLEMVEHFVPQLEV